MILSGALRRGLLIGLLLVGGVVLAQDSTNTPIAPIGTLEAGDFRALAVTADGDRLLVADAENQQVRVYDFTDPAQPDLLTTLDVNGTPVLLAGGAGFGVVAMQTGGDSDSVELVAPAFPSPRVQYQAGWSVYDIPKNPRVLAVSPDSHWAIVITDGGYNLLEINDPGNVNNVPVETSIIDAVLTDTTAYYLRDQSLLAAPLQSGEALRAEQTLALDGVPSRLAINAQATQGVVVLDDTRLVFFDPETMKTTGELVLDGGAVTTLNFLAHGDSEILLVTQAEQPAIRLFDASDPQDVADLGSTDPMTTSIRALTTHAPYIVVTDGATISIFSS